MTLGLLLLYGLACLAFLAALLKPVPLARQLARLSLVACLAGQLLFEILLGFRQGGLPVTSPASAISLLALLALIAAAPLLWRSATLVLGAFVLPALTVIATFALPLAEASTPPGHASLWLGLHTFCILLGFAAWLLAGCGALTYLVHERAILRLDLGGPALPPLELLDRLVASLLLAAFVGLSLGLALGGLWTVSAGIAPGSLSARIAAGAVCWLILAFGLHQRFALKWRGRRTALITACGLLLSFGLTGLLWWLLPAGQSMGLAQ